MQRMSIEDRRRALVEATLAIVARDGVAHATARTITAEAGMPLGSLHYAFESVDALLDAAAAAVTEQERLAAEDALLGDDPVDLVAVLETGLARYVDLLIDQPGRELAYLELTLHAARRRLPMPPSVGAYDNGYRVVGSLLEQAAHATGRQWTAPIEVLARYTVSVLDGITTTWLADHDDARAHDLARLHAAVLTSYATQENHAHGH